MGYFSQKKKYQRENTLLRTMAVILGALTLLLFMPADILNHHPWLTAFQFQIYFLIIAAMLFAAFLVRWSFVTLFAVFLLINFTMTASVANLFFNSITPAGHHLRLTYSAAEPLKVEATGLVKLRSGHLNLVPGLQTPFTTFDKNMQVFTVISVNFEKLSAQELRQAFKSLRQFVAMQDDPVIIYGRFGVPAWSAPFKKFLLTTDLTVKNRLLLLGQSYWFDPLAVPDFYVLAFDNVGVVDLNVESQNKTSPLTLTINLGYY